MQIDAPAFLIVPCQQIQQRVHPAAGLVAAAQQRGLHVLTVDILAVLLPCLQQSQRVRHGAHSHRHLRGVPAVQQRRDLLPGQLRIAEYRRIAHAVHAVTFHTVGGHCFGAALAAPRQRRQRQQAQHQRNTSLSHDILSLFRVFTIIAHGVRHGKQKAPPSAVLFCVHYGW